MKPDHNFCGVLRVATLALLTVVVGGGAGSPVSSAAASDASATKPVRADSVRQRDVVDYINETLRHKQPAPESTDKERRGLQWVLLPTVSYNPVYGAAFGALVSGAGRRGSSESHYSSISVSGNISTQGQVQFQVRSELFTPGENYLAKIDFRYLDTERSTWGLGPIDDQQGEYPMAYLLNRFYMTALRHVSGPVFLGLGFHFDEFSNIVDERANDGETTPYMVYQGGLPTTTRAVGISVNVVSDTRDNLVNAKHGYYLSGAFRDYLADFGSDTNWQELLVEARMYPRLPKLSSNVLAFWMYSWLTFGKAPYLNLPSNGWDTYGRGARGYLAGRIRGSNQIYIESEYRWSLSKDGLWGAVAFINGLSTDDPVARTFARVDLGYGAGLRIKFNKHTDTNLAIDMAWGSDHQRGVWLGMTEAF